jgi:hypothetical protein
MRLAFALAIFIDPDVLLIDDIISVGDEEARKKSIKKIFELKHSGKTVVLVSHEMDMVNKLCDRAILLEKGCIIEQGNPQKVTQRYLETVGDKKAIAVLKQDGLRAVFNSGKLFLSYNGSFLTNKEGACSVFFLPSINSWISSANLCWQVKESSLDRIVAEGETADKAFLQIWELQMLDGGLNWQVKTSGDGVKDPHIDLQFITQYKRWITLDKEGDFPPFLYKTNWQDLGLDRFPEGVLAITGEQDYPDMALELKGQGQFRVFNSGYEQESRIIQAYSDKNGSACVGINLFPQKDRLKDYIANLQAKVSLEKQTEEARLFSQLSITAGHMRLFIDAGNKLIRLYYKEQEITTGDALHCAFNISKQWFHPKDAVWGVQKVSANKIILTQNYKLLDLFHIWELNLLPDNMLEIKVSMTTNNPVLLNNQDFRLEIKGVYKNWATSFEEGNFTVNQYINNIAPVRLKDSKVSEIVLDPGQDVSLPKMFFETTYNSNEQNLNMYWHKTDSGEAICLNSTRIIPFKDRSILPGRSGYFEGRIIFGNRARLQGTSFLSKDIQLSMAKLRFVFDRGRGRIFWGKEELTAGLSAFSSVRSQGIWYDSYQASWDINSKNEEAISLTGYWPNLALSQTWEIRLLGRKSISWKIDMGITEELSLDLGQANLMLSNKYKFWRIPGENKGEFLNEYTKDYDILPFRFWYGNCPDKGIIVDGKDVIPVEFKCASSCDNFKSIVENTDCLYEARLLQYQKKFFLLKPGMYPYFEGVIRIDVEG